MKVSKHHKYVLSVIWSDGTKSKLNVWGYNPDHTLHNLRALNEATKLAGTAYVTKILGMRLAE